MHTSFFHFVIPILLFNRKNFRIASSKTFRGWRRSTPSIMSICLRRFAATCSITAISSESTSRPATIRILRRVAEARTLVSVAVVAFRLLRIIFMVDSWMDGEYGVLSTFWHSKSIHRLLVRRWNRCSTISIARGQSSTRVRCLSEDCRWTWTKVVLRDFNKVKQVILIDRYEKEI